MTTRTVVLMCMVAAAAQAQLTTTVSDFPVSDQTGAYVYRPHVSVHPTDGSFIVSWGDERYGASSAGRLAGIGDIFVGRFSAAGAQTLANSKVGDVHFGFFSEFSMYKSSPLLRANGDILVAYHVDARTTIESIKFDDVYFSAYSSAGTNLIMDRQVNMVGSSGSGYAYQPSVVQFGTDILFVYRYYVNDLYHIGATVVNGTTGVRSGDASVIDNATSGNRAVPAAASNGTRTIVAWADTRLDAQGDIYLQAFAGTNASGTNVKVNTDVGSRYNQFPRVAMNAAGQAVVVWLDTRDHTGGDIYAQRYDPSGGAAGPNIKLTSSGSELWEYAPGVGMDAQGNFVVVWADSVPGGTWRAKTRAFNASGIPVTSILELTSPASESIQPDVSVEPGGRVTYVWLDGRLDAEHGRIFAKRAQLSVTDIEKEESATPLSMRLEQNFPNPFNPSTTIRFELDEGALTEIEIVDVLGRTVERLVSGYMEAGVHAVTWNAGERASGTYVCTMAVRKEDGTNQRAGILMQYVR